MQGASPLASPGAEPGRRGLNLRWRCPAEGLPSGAPEQGAKPASSGGTAVLLAGFSCRIKVFLSYPPSPLPLRGRGSPRLFHARGFAPCIPGAESGRRGLNLRWRYPAGGLPSGAPEQGAKPTPAGACPSGRRLGQMFRYRASYRIFQSRQKRLSRFCNTQNHSHHVCCKTSPGPGTNAGSNQEYIGKVLGGLGASFKKPPTFPRFPVSLFPRFPVSPFPVSISFPCRCAEGCPHRSVRSGWRCRGRRIYRRVWRV